MLYSIVSEIRQIPFIRIIISFATGIALQTHFDILPESLWIAAILLITSLIFIIFLYKIPYKYRFLTGITLHCALILTGAIYKANNRLHYPVFPKDKIIAGGVIVEPPIEKSNSVQTVIKTEYYSNDTDIVKFRTKILCYFKKDSSFTLKYGDKIIFKALINQMQNPGNPYEFDYKSYLADKGITGQTYIDPEEVNIIAKNQGNFLTNLGIRTRETLASIYKANGINGNEYAVLSALTLGDKSELKPEIRSRYAKAGAMHILAVSGLHVGIVFFIFNFILKFLDKRKLFKIIPLKIIKALFLLVLIWFFALLTGFSPSVMRAAVMFSFVTIGNALNRRVSIYNSIAASAFFLLLIDPSLINAVGFQMSYLAVLSIVFIQPRLEKLIVVRNIFLHKIWVLTSVSIAAQIGTTPLSLYYFHMFPNWFWLTNLMVIPLATLIVYAAALLLTFSFVPYLSEIAAFLLKYFTKAMNYSISLVELLPFSATENIPFTIKESLFWYLIIISFLLFIEYRKVLILRISLALLTILSSSLMFQNIKDYNRVEMTIFNVRNNSLYQFVNRNQAIHIQDSTLNEKGFEFAAQNQILQKRLKNTGYRDLHKDSLLNNEFFIRKNEFLFFADKVIAILTRKEQSRYRSTQPVKTDYVILSGNEYFFMDDIKHLYNPDMVIFDSSNRLNRIERWKEECDTLNMAWYSVPEQGAYTLSCMPVEENKVLSVFENKNQN